jgi:hypothetical protein
MTAGTPVDGSSKPPPVEPLISPRHFWGWVPVTNVTVFTFDAHTPSGSTQPRVTSIVSVTYGDCGFWKFSTGRPFVARVMNVFQIWAGKEPPVTRSRVRGGTIEI